MIVSFYANHIAVARELHSLDPFLIFRFICSLQIFGSFLGADCWKRKKEAIILGWWFIYVIFLFACSKVLKFQRTPIWDFSFVKVFFCFAFYNELLLKRILPSVLEFFERQLWHYNLFTIERRYYYNDCFFNSLGEPQTEVHTSIQKTRLW